MEWLVLGEGGIGVREENPRRTQLYSHEFTNTSCESRVSILNDCLTPMCSAPAVFFTDVFQIRNTLILTMSSDFDQIHHFDRRGSKCTFYKTMNLLKKRRTKFIFWQLVQITQFFFVYNRPKAMIYIILFWATVQAATTLVRSKRGNIVKETFGISGLPTLRKHG